MKICALTSPIAFWHLVFLAQRHFSTVLHNLYSVFTFHIRLFCGESKLILISICHLKPSLEILKKTLLRFTPKVTSYLGLMKAQMQYSKSSQCSTVSEKEKKTIKLSPHSEAGVFL